MVILKYDEQIKKYNEDIENLQLRLKQNMENYKNRIAFLKTILKKDLSELERSVIKSTVKDEQVNYKKLMKVTRKEISVSEKDIKKSIKTTTKKRKLFYNKIKKTVKAKIKQERKEEKAIERAEKKLRKTARKNRYYADDVKDDQLKELVGKYTEQIDNKLSNIHESSPPAPKKTEKQLRAEQDRATRKAEKERQKESQKAEKQRERATKKTEKAQHKELEKAEKKAAKELATEARKTKKNNK